MNLGCMTLMQRDIKSVLDESTGLHGSCSCSCWARRNNGAGTWGLGSPVKFRSSGVACPSQDRADTRAWGPLGEALSQSLVSDPRLKLTAVTGCFNKCLILLWCMGRWLLSEGGHLRPHLGIARLRSKLRVYTYSLCIRNRNRLRGFEIKFMVPKGETWEERDGLRAWDWHIHAPIYKIDD